MVFVNALVTFKSTTLSFMSWDKDFKILRQLTPKQYLSFYDVCGAEIGETKRLFVPKTISSSFGHIIDFITLCIIFHYFYYAL